jgi:glycosyltransferase involved in cell wall biosynthesis
MKLNEYCPNKIDVQERLPMKLLLNYGIQSYLHKGQHYILDTFSTYIYEITSQVDELVLILSVSESTPPDNFNPLQQTDVIKIVQIPAFNSMISGFKVRHEVKRIVNQLDLTGITKVLSRFPNPLWGLFYTLAKKNNLPFSLHFVGNPIKLNLDLYKSVKWSYRKAKYAVKVLLLKISRWYIEQTKKEIDGLISNGSEIPNFYFRLRKHDFTSVISSTLTQKDFFEGDKKYFLNNQLNCVFVGFLRPEKGVDLLVKAVGDFKGKVNLQVIGGGNDLNKYQELYSSNCIKFHGHQNREYIDRIFDQSDVLILPSFSEGTPRVIIEAMARKLTVIGTNVGGIPDSIGENNERGILIEPNSIAAIKNAISELLNQPNLLDEKGRKGFKFAKTKTVVQFIQTLLHA